MAIRHKRKNSAGYTWQTGDLVEGQIGLNIADGTLHFDKADGTTVTIASGALTNVVEDTTPQLGGDLDVNGNAIVSASNGDIALEPNGTGIVTANKNIETTGDLKAKEIWSTNSTGDEGGQINLAQPATNSTLAGDTVTIDIWQNRLRMFEQGGDARGVYIERYELLRAMLMSSDNLAAESLAHAHPGGYDQFIKDVNTMVSDLNLKNTVIVDSTGLLAGNKSTVDDLRDFLFASRKYPLIQLLSTEKLYTYQYKKGKRTISIHMRNTNPQMWTYDNIIVTKTGFTSSAGRCLPMLVEKEDKLFAVVTLGNKDVRQRSRNIATMMNEIGIDGK